MRDDYVVVALRQLNDGFICTMYWTGTTYGANKHIGYKGGWSHLSTKAHTYKTLRKAEKGQRKANSRLDASSVRIGYKVFAMKESELWDLISSDRAELPEPKATIIQGGY